MSALSRPKTFAALALVAAGGAAGAWLAARGLALPG
ncbi:MAG: hypothetical protein JWM10_2526, partial [Myxococcaceae bacterium]|nr:hypothetical protein [Myxococcaceae bacterium]